MPYDHRSDAALDRSTNRVMAWGAALMLAMLVLFPLYRWTEPANREDARVEQLESLQEQGGELWSISCSSCHGLAGEGVTAPALNSKQFLQAATDEVDTVAALLAPAKESSN